MLGRTTNPDSGHVWVEVRFTSNGQTTTGYMDSDYIAGRCALDQGLGAYRTTCNAKSPFSNVRAGPAGNRQLLDALDNGVEVFVVKGHSSPLTGHLWFEIKYGENGEKTGFIDADAVKAQCATANR